MFGDTVTTITSRVEQVCEILLSGAHEQLNITSVPFERNWSKFAGIP